VSMSGNVDLHSQIQFLQTRNLASLAGTLFPLFPRQQGNARSGLGQLFGD